MNRVPELPAVRLHPTGIYAALAGALWLSQHGPEAYRQDFARVAEIFRAYRVGRTVSVTLDKAEYGEAMGLLNGIGRVTFQSDPRTHLEAYLIGQLADRAFDDGEQENVS